MSISEDQSQKYETPNLKQETAAAERRLGIHVRTGSGLLAAARHAVAIGASTLQIMSGNPSAWDPGRLDPEQAAQFDRFLTENGLKPAFLHAGYLINLSCRSGRNAPLYAKSVQLLQANLDRGAALGCAYVVVHLGSHKGTSFDEALAVLVEGICRLQIPASPAGRARPACAPAPEAAPAPVTLLLENSAGSGDSVGSNFAELGAALRGAEAAGTSLPLGICLDTAHLWGAGYDLSTPESVNALIAEFDDLVGLERLVMVHFNDSAAELGSKRDRHEHVGCGLIPLGGLKAFLNHPGLASVPMIMETPGKTEPSDEQRMADLKALARIS